MVNQNSETSELTTTLTTTAKGIAWCIAWGGSLIPQHPEVIQQMRQALQSNSPFPDSVQPFLAQAQQLYQFPFPNTQAELAALVKHHPEFWENRIGLVYGGATKIKQYVFEAAKLPDIRGASALLDRINLFDLRAFFGQEKQEKQERSVSIEQWLDRPENFPGLRTALIPQLIIYSTGGNILAFCPAAYVEQLANAIEKRYTHETLTANSCAVGATFRLLEIRLGLLKESIAATPWLDWLQRPETKANPVVQAYFNNCTDEDFRNRKNFNELVTKLAGLFNQRRSGNDTIGRPSRRYPPMFETHPYLRRDEGDRRSTVVQVNELGDRPWLSEPLIRKRIMGQITKREVHYDRLPSWFNNLDLAWQPINCRVTSWVADFAAFLDRSEQSSLKARYYTSQSTITEAQVTEARSLREIGNVSATQGFVAYLYADGNNMGGYIQNDIHTPEELKQFSVDIFNAMKASVYQALAQCLKPRQIWGLNDPDSSDRNGAWIHPFEIVTIGGDDVLLIVPADQALSIAKTIGEKFEQLLLQASRGQSQNTQHPYTTTQPYDPTQVHRYRLPDQSFSAEQCRLSMSIGVLITAENTPIYYAENLVSQLLKSAKKRAKDLKAKGYLGGTIDFLTLKSVTMLSSNIETFRQEGLTQTIGNHTLKQYAAPYTLHEIGGLIDTVKALKKADFPRSQLYQIRSLLDRGKRITMLNYRYFRVRMKNENQQILKREFEDPWCTAKTNEGNLAPWMSLPTDGKIDYETIWRDLVDLYAFIDKDDTPKEDDRPTEPAHQEAGV
jgi:CRISPR-associated protein Cmr2